MSNSEIPTKDLIIVSVVNQRLNIAASKSEKTIIKKRVLLKKRKIRSLNGTFWFFSFFSK